MTSLALALGVASLSAFGMATFGRGWRHSVANHNQHRVPVLVELFTSEGCSSCPSADELLKNLQNEQPDDRALIIPLSEHVDYWNSSNWTDRFSSAKFSQRQMQYVSALHLHEPYTPQMVVDGQAEFVGSDQDSALNFISRAAKHKKADVAIEITDLATHASGSGSLNLKLKIGSLAGTPADPTNDVYVAITEDKLQTNVHGGENGGRTLKHTAVVRFIGKVGSVDPVDPFETHLKLNISPSWKPQDLSVVAFVQAHHSRKILGATIASPQVP